LITDKNTLAVLQESQQRHSPALSKESFRYKQDMSEISQMRYQKDDGEDHQPSLMGYEMDEKSQVLNTLAEYDDRQFMQMDEEMAELSQELDDIILRKKVTENE